MAAHDGAMVSEEEMWPSPFSKDAAHWPNGGFKLEVPKKLTRGEKKRLNKASREKVLKDEVMNVVTDANDDVFKMKKWRFQTIPLWTFPKQQESPVLRQEGTRAGEEDEKQGGKVEEQEKKAEINDKKWSMLFYLLPTLKIISD